jgi:magnesium transporter
MSPPAAVPVAFMRILGYIDSRETDGGNDMLTAYDSVDGKLIKRAATQGLGTAPIWIDLFNPTKDEDLLVEQILGVTIPTREEMQEIEASSRIYQEGGAHYMTALVLHQKEAVPAAPPVATSLFGRSAEPVVTPIPVTTAVTFVLAKNCLVTVRYEEPRALQIFISRNQKGDSPVTSACALLVGLLEAIIDREADRVERVQSEVDKLGHMIFDVHGGQKTQSQSFDVALKQIGREGELTSRSRECLQSLERVLTYLAFAMGERNDDKNLRAHVKTASRDVAGLNDQVSYLSGKVSFLLDATLGMIGLQQNGIIKFFTVVSVALMPPTYGMNFKSMPELEWSLGYPMAIVLMIVSAVVPFIYFKRRGWL